MKPSRFAVSLDSAPRPNLPRDLDTDFKAFTTDPDIAEWLEYDLAKDDESCYVHRAGVIVFRGSVDECWSFLSEIMPKVDTISPLLERKPSLTMLDGGA